MNKLKLLLPLLLLIVVACHHDNTNNNNTQVNTNSPGGVGPNIPSGAAGALYAINDNVYNNDGGGVYDTSAIGLSYAWFVNSTTTKDAGVVLMNADTLYDEDPTFGTANPWYELSLLNGVVFYTSNTVVWNVQGNSANGVPAFNYTDNTAFPVVTGLTLPYPVSIASPLTVHFAVSGAYDAIFYSISGQGQSSLAFTGSSATTATFTTAQLSQVVSSGGQLAVQIMPVKLTPYTVSGKTYYFVKQNAFAVSSPVQ